MTFKIKKINPFLITRMVVLFIIFSIFSCAGFPGSLFGSGKSTIRDLQSAFRSIAQNVQPAIVEISTIIVKKGNGETTPFDFFFNPEQEQQEYNASALGSGIIVRRVGNTVYVITNNHVIEEANKISVKLLDGREYKATLLGKDSKKDLALVSFETEEQDIIIAKLGDSNKLLVGDWAIAIGNPLGLGSSLTVGVISALGRKGPGIIRDFIQTDAAINKGNSGGALVNIDGEVVGINTWIASPTGGSIGLGFAIPINAVKPAIDDFLDFGFLQYGWIGAQIHDVTTDIVAEFGLKDNLGAQIINLYAEGPAEKGGLLPGDVVLSIDSRKIDSADTLISVIGSLTANSSYEFKIIRLGKAMTLKIQIGKRIDEEEIAKMIKQFKPGFSVLKINDEVRKLVKLPDTTKGMIVISVEKGTNAQILGLMEGDVITAINGKDVNSLSEYYQLLNEKTTIDLTVLRQTENIKIQLKW